VAPGARGARARTLLRRGQPEVISSLRFTSARKPRIAASWF